METRASTPYVKIAFAILWASGVLASLLVLLLFPVLRAETSRDPFSFLFGVLIGGPVGWLSLLYALVHPPNGPQWGSLDANFAVFLWIASIALTLGLAWLITIPLRSRERQRIAEELSQQEVARYAAEQQAARNSAERKLRAIVSDLQAFSSELGGLLLRSNSSLDQAEYEFSDGAFAPFWDAIEETTCTLLTLESHIRCIASLTEDSTRLSQSWELSLPALFYRDIPPDIAGAVARLRIIVRRAQKEPNFAKIYEQRRTNQLLIGGFASFGEALAHLADRLTESFGSLEASILASTDSSAREASFRIIEQLSSLRDNLERDARARRSHEQQQLDLLNNIQHRRKPG